MGSCPVGGPLHVGGQSSSIMGIWDSEALTNLLTARFYPLMYIIFAKMKIFILAKMKN